MSPPSGRRAGARVAGAAALCAAVLACTVPVRLDVDRARRMLERPPRSAVPVLEQIPTGQTHAPEALRATSGELRAIPLEWDPVLTGEIHGYVIERSEAREGAFAPIAAVAGRANTAYVDRGPRQVPSPSSRASGAEHAADAELGDGTTRFYRVRSYAPSGLVGRNASVVVAGTTAAPPPPPEGLRAYSHRPRQVPLSWRAHPDPTVAGYVIERSPSSRGGFERLVQLDGRFQTVYVDTGLGDLRVFYYRVRARNSAGGEGDPSAPVRAVTKSEPLPPVGLRVVGRRLGANQLGWEPNVEQDLFEYRLRRTRQDGDANEPVAAVSANATSAVDPEVGADERVVYTVVAVDRDGLKSDPSQGVEARSEGYDLAAVVRRDGVQLTWNPRPAEAFRRSRILRGGRLRPREIAVAEGGAYLDRTAKPGSRYRYVVVLERADGTQAPPSSEVEIRVPDR